MSNKIIFRTIALALAVISIFVIGFFLVPTPTVLNQTGIEEKITTKSPFVIFFSQPMEKQSAIRAISIIPPLQGKWEWKSSRLLQYNPESVLSFGEQYEVRIGSGAKSIFKKQLKESRIIRFIVTGPPFVQFVSPFTPSEAPPTVRADQPITVVFDRPVNQTIDQKELFSIDPPAKGRIDWVSRNAFQFIPEQWQYSTFYTFTVPAGINALSGGVTEQEFEWQVFTPRIKVISSIPEQGSEAVELSESIRLELNQEIDLDSVKPGINILLFPSNDLDASKSRKSDGFLNAEITKEGKTLVIKPTFPYLAGQEHRLVLKADLESKEGDLPMGEEFELKFKTKGVKSVLADSAVENSNSGSLAWSNPQEILSFAQGHAPSVELLTQIPLRPLQLTLKLCRMSEEEFFEMNRTCSGAQTIHHEWRSNSKNLVLDLSELFKEKQWKNGLYFFAAKHEDKEIIQPFLVSNVSLLLKQSQKDLLVWANDSKTGNPIDRLAMEIYSHDGQLIKTGKTDSQGIYALKELLPKGIYIKSSNQKYWGFIGESWGNVSADFRGIWSDPMESRVYFYTDKESYAPGDEIYFYGLYRADDDAELNFAEESPVAIELQDQDGNNVTSSPIYPIRDGAFYGKLQIPASCVAGKYNLTLIFSGETNDNNLIHPINIQEAGQTVFQLEILPSKQVFTENKPVGFQVQSQAYGGLTASGAKGNYILSRVFEPLNFKDGERKYIFGQQLNTNSLFSEMLIEKDFTLDERGKMQLIFDPKIIQLKSGYRYTLDIKMHEGWLGGIGKKINFYIHPGQYYIGLSPERNWIKSGEELGIYLVSKNLQGQTIQGKKVRLTLKSEKASFTSFDFPITKIVTTKKEEEKIIFTLPKEANGFYVLLAESEDEEGNIIKSMTGFYVLGNNPIDSQKFKLVIDQPEGLDGGKVRLRLVYPSRLSSQNFLLTHERLGLHEYQIQNLKESKGFVEFLITDSMAPNEFFTASVWDPQAGKWMSDTVNLPVSLREKEIKADINSEIIEQDGQKKGKLIFSTKDYQERPVSAQVALGVVSPDSSGPTDPLTFFFGQRALQVKSVLGFNNAVKSQDSASPIFFGNFIDAALCSQKTFYINPLIRTDNAGKAEITFPLPTDFQIGMVYAIAWKDADRFGFTKRRFSAPVPLKILPISPAGASVGDRFVLLARFYNQSSKEINTDIELIGDSIEIFESAKKNITIAPQESADISWDIKINPTSRPSLPLVFRAPTTFLTYELPIHQLKMERPSYNLLSAAGNLLNSVLNEDKKSVKNMLTNLLSFKTKEGGYAFWREGAEPDVFFSSYALWALNQALSKDNDTIRYLWKKLQNAETLSAEERIFTLWALSEADEYDTKSALVMYQKRGEMPLYSQGLLLVTLNNLVKAGQKSLYLFVKRLEAELAEKAIQDSGNAYFADDGKGKYVRGSENITGILAWALCSVNPENPFLNNFLSVFGRRTDSQSVSSWPLVFKKLFLAKYTADALPSDKTHFSSALSDDFILNRRYTFLKTGLTATNFKKGEVYRGELMLINPHDASYVTLEEMLPAGLTAIAFSPVMTDSGIRAEEEKAIKYGYTWQYNPIWHFDHRELLPDRLSFFAAHLPAGVYRIEFLAEAKTTGRFRHLPAQVYSLLNPVIAPQEEEMIEVAE